MGAVLDRINEFIKEALLGWVKSNLGGMFGDVNTKVGTIAAEVGRTPSSWNGSAFSMVRGLSDTVVLPIAGMVIAFVLCHELISMVMDRNNMHDFDTWLFFKYIFKAGVAVMLLGRTSDIVMGIFDIGSHLVSEAAGFTAASTYLDVEDTLEAMLDAGIASMGIGELLGLGVESMLASLGMKIMSVLITIVLYGRMIEAYLYISVAPVPFATLGNRVLSGIGANYIKGVAALAFQGFFIMVCVAIYAALVQTVSVSGNIHSALWQSMAYTALLCFALLRTGTLAKNILHAS